MSKEVTFDSIHRKPKILLFDIETAPNVVYTWGIWEQNAIDVVEDWYILSFVAKWLDSPTIISKGLPHYKTFKKDKKSDKELVQAIWDLFNEADIIVAHNGDDFDIKKCQTRFLKYGMSAPAPFKTVDTKKVAKRYFRFDSNKLDELGRQLGLGRKIHHDGFDLWKGCMAGDPASWKKMLDYNKGDVILLEKVYLKLRPYMTTHPNWNVFTGEYHTCPNCGSEKIQRQGRRVTRVSTYQRYSCLDCGAWSHGQAEAKTKGVTRIR